MNARLPAVLVTAGVLLLTGCGGTAPSRSATAATTTVTATATETQAHDTVEATPIPTTAPSRPAPEIAYAAMTAYVDHGGDAGAWFAGLAPYLSTQAQERFYGTDPVNIAATQTVGSPVAVDVSDYLQWLDQPTNAGTYHLLLSRAEDGSWQVETITPPADGPTT